MATDLLLIHPSHITFRFELKKQSCCVVRLTNHDSHYVAFKVKTTSPKKYCVRPTVGIVQPHGTADFTVTMQAQRTAPPDFNCKDKFLVQSAVVPAGTTEDDISSDLVEKSLEVTQGLEEDGTDRGTVPRLVEKEGDMKQVNDIEKLSFHKDFKELQSRLSIMDAKLREAEGTIVKLNEEKCRNTREKNLLKQELEMMKKKIKIKRAQEGFPFLFVCVVSLVSMAVGYYIHP